MPFSNPITAGTILVQPAIQSPNFNQAAMTGWAIKADGSAFFFNITATGTITSTTMVVQGSAGGVFVYSGVPATGNLIGSITGTGGANDGHGNAYLAGHTSYNPASSPLIACSVQSGQISFQSAPSAAGPWGVDTSLNDVSSAFAQGTMELGGALVILGPGNSGSLLQVENLIAATSPLVALDGKTASDVVLGAFTQGQLSPTPGFQVQANGQVQLEFGITTGQMLTIWNTSSSTGNPNVQLQGTGSTDNMLGIKISTDSSNRLKIDASGKMQWGSGTAAQDTSLYRTAAGSQLAADTILANVSGSPETWHTLGTLAGATVGKGRFRLLPDGEVKVEIDVSFASLTSVPITFSTTLPVAYQVPGSVDVRMPLSQTDSGGAIARLFIGSASGSNPGQVQIAGFASGQVRGTYSTYVSYSIL